MRSGYVLYALGGWGLRSIRESVPRRSREQRP